MSKILHCCTAAIFVTYNTTFDERSAPRDLLHKQRTSTTTAVLSSIAGTQRSFDEGSGCRKSALYKHNLPGPSWVRMSYLIEVKSGYYVELEVELHLEEASKLRESSCSE